MTRPPDFDLATVEGDKMAVRCEWCAVEYTPTASCRGRFCSQPCWGQAQREASHERAVGRFWSLVVKAGHDSCWLWSGRFNNVGYPTFKVSRQRWLAHRFIYTAQHGDIPGHLVIDHTCGNKMCVRPDHLEAVTPQENIRRTRRYRERRERCANGHPATPELTYYAKNGSPVCLVCRRASDRKRYPFRPHVVARHAV